MSAPETGYFQFSTVHGSCYTFKEQFSLAPFGDLVPDPEWTAGSLWNGVFAHYFTEAVSEVLGAL